MAGMFGDAGGANTAASNAAFKQQLNKVYAWYTGGFLSLCGRAGDPGASGSEP
jgi:hypothetical protein